jgi:hypothetical protein
MELPDRPNVAMNGSLAHTSEVKIVIHPAVEFATEGSGGKPVVGHGMSPFWSCSPTRMHLLELSCVSLSGTSLNCRSFSDEHSDSLLRSGHHQVG